MHKPVQDRPGEEVALDRAMTSIDPLLQASLQREQKRRRLRLLLWGGCAMLGIGSVWGIWLLLAVAQVQGGGAPQDPGEGKSEVERAVEAAALAKEGWRLAQSGNAVEAERKFEQACELDATDANVWNGLGWSRIHQGDSTGALEAFEKALSIDAKHGGALNGAGQAHFVRHAYAKAESYFQRAGDDAPAALFGLTRLQLLQGKFDDAGQALERLTRMGTGELDPTLLADMRDAIKSRSVSDALRKKLEPPAETEAAGQNARAKAGANDVIERNAEGWRLFNAGESRAAELAFRQALKTAPRHIAAQNGLGFALLNQGKHREALPIFEALVASNREHPGFVNGLARAYAASGNLDKAIETWRMVETGTGEVNACTWGLANALVETKQHADALKVLERIQASDPSNAQVREMIERCQQAIKNN